MKLNLQILELELADLCLESAFHNDRLERSLRFPVIAGDFCTPEPGLLYLLQPHTKVTLPAGQVCSFIFIGNLPEGLRGTACSWLLLKDDIDPFYLIIQLQEIFERYNRWEIALLEAITEKKSIKQLGILSEPFIRHPFQLYDSEILCIFSILNEQYYTLPEHYEVQYDKMYLNPDDTSTLLLSPTVQTAMNKRTPVLFEPDYFPIRAIAQSLHLADKYVGNIVMDEVGQPFRDGDFTLLHFLGQTIEKYLRHNNILSLGRPFEFEEIMTAMLQHRLVEENRLSLFLDSLDFQTNDSFFCMVITSDTPEHNRNLLSLLSLQISQATQSKCYLEFETNLVFVFRVTEKRTREAFLQIVLPILREYFVRCGISLPFRDFTNLYYYHWQCLRALELGQVKNPTYWFYRFENYMLEHLLQGSYAKLIPEVMMPEGLLRLMEYDRQNNTEFLHILRTYLDQNMSLTAAAKALYVHKNTLLYRLEKIKDILQMNLEDADTRLLLSAALRIFEH